MFYSAVFVSVSETLKRVTHQDTVEIGPTLQRSRGIIEIGQCTVKAKLFYYAILVADRSEAGRRPVADLLARASSLLAS